ncbi:MAG TPA: glycosyltransferase family 2 protein [Pyrinomonadaceae bacterium]|nr:glycosyltransferase family 2 protein [Pyrinomonadaceae bacterium]
MLVTFPADQGDIIKDFVEWHLDLGLDVILTEDLNSSDDTQEILDSFSETGRVDWFPTKVKDYKNCRPAESLAELARDRHGADWVIMCDVDEFLCPQGDDLRSILQRAAAEDITAIRVDCFNMTGALENEGRATEARIWRIAQPIQESFEQQLSGQIPAPYIFIRHPPKTIVRMDAFLEYGWGSHDVKTSRGKTAEFSELKFHHFPIRGFETFQKKVQNVANFFEINKHYEDWWGWHWRRWIRLNEEGRLREEYENQFLTPARAEELIRDGTCVVDTTISNWVANRSARPVTNQV